MYNEQGSLSQNQQAILRAIEAQKEFCAGRKLSGEMLELAKKKVEALLLEARDRADREARQAFEKASREGYEKGYQDGKEEARKESEKLKKAQQDLMQEHQTLFKVLYDSYRKKKDDIFSMLEADIVKILSVLVEKIIRDKIEEDPSSLVRTVRDASMLMEKAQKIVIRLNPHEYQQLGRDYFINYITLPDVDIREDARVDVHGFIIESDMGLVDGQISTQMEAIRTILFEKLSERYKDDGDA